MTSKEIIGKRIKEISKRKGISGKDLAELIGKSTPYVSGVITGKQGISIDTLDLFASALGVPASELIKDTSKQSEDPVLICPHCGKEIRICIKTE